jgi:acetyl esterase
MSAYRDDFILDDLKILKPLRYQRYSHIRRVLFNFFSVIMIRVLKPRRTIAFERFWVTAKDGKRFRVTRYRFRHREGIRPAILYYHGGSFQLEESPIHVRMMCDLVEKTTFDVYAVRYRLAPKWRHPRAIEDAYEALCWVDQNKEVFHHDRMMVAGDSAGGHIAGAVALMSLHRKGPVIDRQMLIYPVIQRQIETPSIKAFDKTPVFNSTLNKSMWTIYCPKDGQERYEGLPLDPTRLKGLPPTYIETAEFDPLRDEGILYAEALFQAGVVVKTSFTIGTVHGYDGAFMSKSAKAATDERARFLRADINPEDAFDLKHLT